MKCVYAFPFSENNTISIWNNGKGIPVVEHKVEKVYVPALIFGQLLTSSNYDDDEKKVTGESNHRIMKTHLFLLLCPYNTLADVFKSKCLNHLDFISLVLTIFSIGCDTITTTDENLMRSRAVMTMPGTTFSKSPTM